jgi:hypothetical protein
MATSAEEITYEAGRHALGEQEAFVAGIRSRTGTLLAAHALVASFLGAPALRDGGSNFCGWTALAVFITGLVLAARILGEWDVRFSLEPEVLHALLSREQDAARVLVVAGSAYAEVRDGNVPLVNRMTGLANLFGFLMVVQAVAWIVALVL